MKRLLDYIGSRRSAIMLLLVTTGVILLSNLLPKPYILTDKEVSAMKRERPLTYYMSSRFNVAEVTKSPYFITVTVFLFASITACTLRRVKTGLKEAERGVRIPEITSLTIRHSIEVSDCMDAETAAAGVLARRRWKMAKAGTDEARVLYSKKGFDGLWGSVAFHAGMCIVLIGVFISTQTRFNGRLLLTQDFDIDPALVLKGLSATEKYVFPVRRMALASFEPVFREGFPLEYTANLLNRDLYGREYTEVARVNEPVSAGGYQFLLSRYGFAPRIVLKDASGKVVSDDIVNLVVFNPNQEDSFPLLKGKFTARVRFFPDFYIDTSTGTAATRTKIPRNPVFIVSLERGGNKVEGGFVKMGGTLGFEGYTLEFRDIRYWVQLDVSKDSGVPVITAGFFAIIAGLALRLLLNEKAVWIIIKENKIGVGGRARFFPALFEQEIKGLAEELSVRKP